ncbi:hypothetical protein PMIN04_001495 [Paraphaeosphaeria minitans]|uniref:Uncharacterized protein n=1 Tax=Paraphaeosphaeria minitans TaxID=565426 RepID=A0A9P6GI38_9PLEO|nr:hypothetical protein PMIN01_05709 [Paraphaeosphaeria minitans]
MNHGTEQKLETLQKQLGEFTKIATNLTAHSLSPFIMPPQSAGGHDDPKYLELWGITSSHFRAITKWENAVGKLQRQFAEHRVVKLSPKIFQAFQELQQRLERQEKRQHELEKFKKSAHSLVQTHEINIGVCHRNIRNIVQETEKLRISVTALQATVDKGVISTSQKIIGSVSPRELQSDCQVSPDSSPATVEEERDRKLLRTLEQRLKFVELAHERWEAGPAKGGSPNRNPDSTPTQLLNTLEEQPLEILGQQLLESLGKHLMADMTQQLRDFQQQVWENLEQMEQRLLVTMKQWLLEAMYQYISETIRQELLAAMDQQIAEVLEQRLSKTAERLPTKLPVKQALAISEQRRLAVLDHNFTKLHGYPSSRLSETQVFKSLEQRCMESLKPQLINKLMPQFEARIKEASRATRTLVKSRMSNLEGRMLPALHEKDEQVMDLQVAQERMTQSLENIAERLEMLVERNKALEVKSDELKHMVGLREAIDATDIDSPNSPPQTPPCFMGNEATSPDSEGASNKRRRLEKSLERVQSGGSSAAGDVNFRKSKKPPFGRILKMEIFIRNMEDSSRDSFTSVFRKELQMPESVKDAMSATLLYTYEGRAMVTGKANIHGCLRSEFCSRSEWFIGQEEQAACMRCTKNGYACLLLTRRGQKRVLVLLPLIEELRTGLKVDQEGYWLSEQSEKKVQD